MFKNALYVLLILLSVVTVFSNIDSEAIIRKAEDMAKGKSMQGTFQMKIVTPDYKRNLKMDIWNDGKDNSLIITREPKKEAGNKMLKIDKELYSYLKATETSMKLPASMMLQSWNGSDLTNDDLVRESDMVDDYNIKYLKDDEIDNIKCWKFELIPKPDAPVVWGKIYYWVRQVDYLPSKVTYYDEDGTLHRTMLFQKIKKMGDRKIPTVWKVISETKKGYYTEFIYEKVEFDKNIPKRIFSLRELER